MATTLTESKSQIVELSEKAFNIFCDDVSGMLDVDMKCSRQEFGNEGTNGLEKRFGNPVAVTSVEAEGVINGTFHFVFDQQGLFILDGVIFMQPEEVIRQNIKSGSPEKAKDMSDEFTEVGIAMVGAWDRVFRKELDCHGRLTHTNTFIGNPWDKSEVGTSLPGNEKFEFIEYQMTSGSYHPFKCGVIFPKKLFADVPVTASEQSKPPDEKEKELIKPDEENASNQPEQPEQKNKAAAKKKRKDVKEKEDNSADKNENENHPVSKAIKKMSSSPAALSGEPDQTEKHKDSNTTDIPLAIPAEDIMQKDVLWGSPDDDVQQTLAKIQEHNIGYVMIGRDKTLQGIVSKSDLTAALSPYLRPEFAKWHKPSDDASLKIRLKWIMSSPVVTTSPETTLAEIMEKMYQCGRRALPVVDQQGKVQGLVTVFDIFKGLLKQSSSDKQIHLNRQALPGETGENSPFPL